MLNYSIFTTYFVFIAICFVMPTSLLAAANRTTYQAKIIKPDGLPLEAAAVNFRFTILDPTGSCVLYVENYSAINMQDSGGVISFALGAGNRSFPTSGTANTFATVFDNATPSFSCQSPGTYIPTSVDARKIVMQFQDASGWQTLPAMLINAVPYAMYATKAENSTTLNNKADSAFVEYATLASLSCASDQAIKFNGVSFSCITVGSSGTAVTSATITAALGYTPANENSFSNLNSNLSTVSSTVFSVSSTIQNLGHTVTSLSNTVAASFAAITSSQWLSSGTAIIYNDGNIGVGVANPITRLDVSGGVRLGHEGATCNSSFAGTLRYNLALVEYCNGTSWVAFGVSGAGVLSINGLVSGAQTFAMGSSGAAPNISSTGTVHTFNFPFASESTTTSGLISNSEYVLFSNKLNATNSAIVSALGYIPASNSALSNYLEKSNNLSDLSNTATARNNLGLGSLATASSIDLGSASATGVISDARLVTQAGVVSGTQYTKVSVDSKGRVIAGTHFTSSDVMTALGYTPASASASTQWNTSGTTINYVAGNVGVGTSNPVSVFQVAQAPTATANYGLVSLGHGPFDGISSGYYTGNPNGVVQAINTATGFLGDFVNYQNGTSDSRFIVKSSGAIVSGRGQANGSLAYSFGGLNSANGNFSFATGHFNNSNGNYSFSSGLFSNATGDYSTAMGYSLTANSQGLTAVGINNVIPTGTSLNSWQANDPVFVVGNGQGSSPASASTAMTVLKSGQVGIGTMSPVTKLDVSGAIKISMDSVTCAASYAGALRYNSGSVEYCNGAIWSAFGVAGSGIANFNGSTSGAQTFSYGTAGTTPAFVTANGIHTLNIPLASAASVTGGLLSNADYTAFTNKITSSAASIVQVLGYFPADQAALTDLTSTVGAVSATASAALTTANSKITSSAAAITQVLGYVPAASGVVSSQWNTNGSDINYLAGRVGIGVASPTEKLEINGNIKLSGFSTVTTSGKVNAGAFISDQLSFGATYASSSTTKEVPPQDDVNGVFMKLSNTSALVGTGSYIYLNAKNSTQKSYIGTIATASGSSPAIVIGRKTGVLSYQESMRIDESGNVGIGTATPSQKLVVGDDIGNISGNNAAVIGASGSGNSQLFMGNDTNNFGNLFWDGANKDLILRLKNAGVVNSNQLVLDASGSVGVGTNILSGGSGDSIIDGQLQVKGSASSTLLNLRGQSTDYAGLKIKVGAGNISGGSDYFDFTLRPSATAGVGTVSDQTMIRFHNTFSRIYADLLLNPSGGNVGIGIDSPVYPLHTVSPFAKTDTVERVVSKFNSNEALSSNPFGLGISIIGGALIASRSVNLQTGDHNLANGGNLLLQANGGNVGIGTVTPNLKLSVFAADSGGASASTSTSPNGALMIGSVGTNITGTMGVEGNVSPQYMWIQPRNRVNALYYNTILNPNGGNVGIGTINPSYKLDVNGSINATAVLINGVAVGAGGTQWASGGGGAISYSGGNVGLGVSSPLGKLHIDQGDSGVPSFLGTLNAPSNQNIMFLKQLNAGGDGAPTSALMRIDNRGANPTFYSSNNGANPFIITSSGNVGIGTATPSSKLQVSGGTIRSDLGSAGTAFVTTGLGSNFQIIHDGTSNVGILNSGGGIQFRDTTGTINNVTILPSGNVGFGTGTPAAKLDLGGNTASATQAILTRGADINFQLVAQNGSGSNTVGQEVSRFGINYSGAGWNTGFRFLRGGGATDGTLAIDTNGTEAMRVLPAGYVGIGTTAPTDPLNVWNQYTTDNNSVQTVATIVRGAGSGTAGATGIGARLRFGAIATDGIIRYPAAVDGVLSNATAGSVTGDLSLRTSASGQLNEVMRLTSNGYVGIGTASATSPLQLGRVFSFQQDINSGYIGSNFGSSTSGNYLVTGNYAVQQMFDSAAGAIIFKNAPIGTAGNAITYAERMRIDSAGNVGIGTANPVNPLDVKGWISSYPVSINNSGFQITTSGTQVASVGTAGWVIRGINPSSPYGGNLGGSLAYESWNGVSMIQAMAITSGGSVGIGTTSPNYKLDVQGGGVNASAGYTQTSDIRLKTNLVYLQSNEALAKIMQLNAINYDWKDQKKYGHFREIGLIAQEVEKVYPEAVKKDSLGFLSVSYSNLVAPIVESIKALYQLINNEKTQNIKQDREIASLKQENLELKSKVKELDAVKTYLCAKDPKAEICN